MKIEDLQKYIHNSSTDLYSFAYVLIPDDLQATQLMIDCVQSFLIQKNTLIDRAVCTKGIDTNDFFIEVKLNLLKIIFELSRKRYQQLKMSFHDVEKNGGFFSLDFDEKSVLYLKEKSLLELNSIEYITSLNQAEVLAFLASARTKMVHLIASERMFQNEIGGLA